MFVKKKVFLIYSVLHATSFTGIQPSLEHPYESIAKIAQQAVDSLDQAVIQAVEALSNEQLTDESSTTKQVRPRSTNYGQMIIARAIAARQTMQTASHQLARLQEEIPQAATEQARNKMIDETHRYMEQLDQASQELTRIATQEIKTNHDAIGIQDHKDYLAMFGLYTREALYRS